MLSTKWKKRWFVLCDMVLYYYDDPNDVGILKGSLDLGTVTSITQEYRSKDEVYYELVGKTTGGEAATWDIKFMEDEPKAFSEMWKRKISRSCHCITGINAFPTDISINRHDVASKNASMLAGSFEVKRTNSGHIVEQRSVNAVRRLSMAPSNSGSFHKGGVAKKRASIFGL